ncbi:MAG: phosphatidylserine decarboxylase [Desulfobaccales bacterium]
MTCLTISLLLAVLTGYLYWRYVWFFRNPSRVPPPGESLVSPADGTVVYVTQVAPQQEVIMIKQGLAATLTDIVREDLASAKILIGIFMSPFSVHYNRAPLPGKINFIRHYPAKVKNFCMAPMHWRTLLKRAPFYENSRHIIHNERLVTKMEGRFKGEALSYYVVQIAGKSVRGIDSYFKPGEEVTKGEVFGMIRIGSQVDLVAPLLPEMNIMVQPGDKVRAGETVLIA